jgi:hypothetical protein
MVPSSLAHDSHTVCPSDLYTAALLAWFAGLQPQSTHPYVAGRCPRAWRDTSRSDILVGTFPTWTRRPYQVRWLPSARARRGNKTPNTSHTHTHTHTQRSEVLHIQYSFIINSMHVLTMQCLLFYPGIHPILSKGGITKRQYV